MLILNIAAIVCIGLMTGVEFAVSAFIDPVLWKLERNAQMEAIRLVQPEVVNAPRDRRRYAIGHKRLQSAPF
jgi:hypothetical protein